MATIVTAPASPAMTEQARTDAEIVDILVGPVGDALAAWAGRFAAPLDSPAAYPDSPEAILQEVDTRELVAWVAVAARLSAMDDERGSVEEMLRSTRIEAAVRAEVEHRVEALTDTVGPF